MPPYSIISQQYPKIAVLSYPFANCPSPRRLAKETAVSLEGLRWKSMLQLTSLDRYALQEFMIDKESAQQQFLEGMKVNRSIIETVRPL